MRYISPSFKESEVISLQKKVYFYPIEVEVSNGTICSLELNTEDMLDFVLRCSYESITIHKRKSAILINDKEVII